MDFGPKSKFLIEFLSHIDVDGRVVVLADLAELGHDYKAGDMLKTYRELKYVCEQWDMENIDDFMLDIYEFVENRYMSVRSKLGANAMRMVSAISEADDDKKEQSRKNKEKFEKEGEKRKKSEQAPIAKAARSKGESQNDMADGVDVDKSTISRWKTGNRHPSFDSLKRLSDRYGKGLVNQLLGT